ncbi:MAG: hypothetical protein K0R67_2383, partial [Paenibacillus sp.]|nr:hypothetical protein [Paenibacillus sp.]
MPVLIVISLVTVSMAWFIYGQTAESMKSKGFATLEVTKIGIENALYARKTAEEVMEKEMVSQAVLLSLLMEKGLTFDQVTAVSKKGQIDDIWITDAAGETVLTNAGPDVKFNFSVDPKQQAYEFMDLISRKKEAVTQPAQPRTIDPKVYKYVGVGGWTLPRIVQVGRDGAKLTELENRIGPKPIIQQLKERVGDEVLFTGIVQADRKLAFSSDDAVKEAEGSLGTLVQETLQSGNHQVAASTYLGHKVLYYAAPLTNGQTLVLAISTEVLNRILWTTVVSVLLALLISGATLFLIVNRQFRRLDDLKSSMNGLAQGEGDLTQRLPVGSKDEIGQLSQAMNRFVEKIQSIVTEVKGSTASSMQGTDDIHRISGETTEIAREMNVTME